LIHRLTYHLLLLLLMASLCAGCRTDTKTLNERISLWRKDKIPYGTWYAYENLSYLFADAEIFINQRSPDLSKSFDVREFTGFMNDFDTKSAAYIIISPQLLADVNEVNAIFNFISRGNHVFVSTFRMSENFLDSLNLKPAFYSGFANYHDSLLTSIDDPSYYFDSTSFGYPGKALDNYFVNLDSNVTTILGENEAGQPNFVKFTYEGGGSLYLHLAPIAFSNFFLLHKENNSFYNHALSYLPAEIQKIWWDDYFRYHMGGQKNDFSSLKVIMENKSLRWAFWLTILLFALIYLFESKRKQRIIPTIAPHRNASLDFVKTIGRLYYQRGDNKNLSAKMTAHFMDHVRTRFNIRTANLDEDFINRLAYKSNHSKESIQNIVNSINYMKDSYSVSDDELREFNSKLENFYKHS
jgi:hypothetical protein